MKITNRDWLIANMSDAELATILQRGAKHSRYGCEYCIFGIRFWRQQVPYTTDARPGKCGTTPCAEGIRQWLEAEYKEQCGFADRCDRFDSESDICKYGRIDKCQGRDKGDLLDK